MTTPVTVVVATKDRRDSALGTVARLRALRSRPPVVVVVGGQDGTAAAVRASFPDVAVIRQTGAPGVAAARNLGVAAAGTPLVAFADDDSWWTEGALERAAPHFAGCPRLGLLAAAIRVGPEGRLDPTCAAMAASPLTGAALPGPEVLGFVACGAIVRKSAFLEVGGFPEDYGIGGEEEPLALSLAAAGWGCAYVADVVAVHMPANVERDTRRRERQLTRNDLWTAWRYRRGVGVALRTAAVLRGATTPARLRGVADAVVGLPAAVQRRRPIPRPVETRRRLLG